jgi:hypothetical protein
MNALSSNVAGGASTATGYGALFSSTASSNTAEGFAALNKNTTGPGNTAIGVNGLFNNTMGGSNTAVGVNAMLSNTTGANNIAVGVGAGQALTIGNNNIEIGNAGVAAETNAIRIGTQGMQTQTYIAGISGAAVTGADVVVASNGRLGVGPPSSARYKHDVRDIGEASTKLMKLRPVTFRYNNDPTNMVQYGLVAEKVARVYPELVVYGPDGNLLTVGYSTLSSMLLNELQKENRRLQKQAQDNECEAEQIRQLTAARSRAGGTEPETETLRLEKQTEQMAQLKDMFKQAIAAQKGSDDRRLK